MDEQTYIHSCMHWFSHWSWKLLEIPIPHLQKWWWFLLRSILDCFVLNGYSTLADGAFPRSEVPRGDIAVFRGINKRMAGIGLASVFSSYIITFYYNVIISWALIYFVMSFVSPLPWSESKEDFVWKCDKTKVTRAEQFFNIDVIRYYDDQCKPYKDGDPS